MGSIEFIKPGSTFLSSVVLKSLPHQEKFFGMPRIKPGPLGAKPEWFPLCYAAPPPRELITAESSIVGRALEQFVIDGYR